MTITCRLIGHAICQMAPTDEPRECFRCGDQFDPGVRVRDDLGFTLAWLHLTHRVRYCRSLRRVRDWFKCPDCGRRFGRHDTKNCFPF